MRRFAHQLSVVAWCRRSLDNHVSSRASMRASAASMSCKQIHTGRSETPRRRQRTPITLVLERPLRVAREQRERERAAERQREAARPGLERCRCLHVAARASSSPVRASARRAPKSARDPARARPAARSRVSRSHHVQAAAPPRARAAYRARARWSCLPRSAAPAHRAAASAARCPRRSPRRRTLRSTSDSTATACVPVVSFATGVRRRRRSACSVLAPARSRIRPSSSTTKNVR